LNIYKRAIEYCTKIYRFSAKLPSNEKYGLIPQIRRAAISIPLNISEGSGCNTDKEFSQFIKICQNTPQLCWGDEWPSLSPGGRGLG